MTYLKKCSLFIFVLLFLPSVLPYAGASRAELNGQDEFLLNGIDFGEGITIHDVSLKNGELILCLDMDT